MYYLDPRLGQPGQGKSVYLFAHARTGMFLPLLTASKVSNGKKMLGMIVEVWTADDQRFLYVITDSTATRRSTMCSTERFVATRARRTGDWQEIKGKEGGGKQKQTKYIYKTNKDTEQQSYKKIQKQTKLKPQRQ